MAIGYYYECVACRSMISCNIPGPIQVTPHCPVCDKHGMVLTNNIFVMWEPVVL